MVEADDAGARTFMFLRNGEAEPAQIDWSSGLEGVRQAIAEALNAKNVAFLLGAGCSSLITDGIEVGIPTMATLAKEFCGETLQARAAGFYDASPSEGMEAVGDDGKAPLEATGDVAEASADNGRGSRDVVLDVLEQGRFGGETQPEEKDATAWRLSAAEVKCLDELGLDLEDGYNRNLERLMEVLFGQRFVLQRSKKAAHWPQLDLINSIIKKIQVFLWSRVTVGAFTKDDHSIRDLYERFYRKLVLRDRALPRPWVFTTNYDVFNETAMDRLGIPYCNGFTGVVERRFNPAVFRYALSEQLDVGNRKWAVVDAFVYLCKLHGSVSWMEDDHGLFPIREKWPADDASKIMIYPTPAKQNASLASPYADLFREFQVRVVREQSILVTVGYAFGDEHLNNIIYQALTIPTFRLIIFASPDTQGDIAKLRALNDPRIWIIGGDGPTESARAHYFHTVVEHFLPQRPSERIDDAVRKVLLTMAPRKDDEQ
jgi:SIR2-like domain